MSKSKFYKLSFTWGLPLSLLGVIVCGALMIAGYRPKRYGHCYYIAIGKAWGGLEFGWFFLVDKREPEYLKNHELGHGYQNTRYGPGMLILWLIAAVRYWLQRCGVALEYYGWRFESEATEIGYKVMKGWQV